MGITKKYSYYVMAFAGLGGFLYGFDVGVISGALVFIEKDLGLNESQISLIVAAVLGGGAAATLITGPLADIIGRKVMIIISGILFILGIYLTVIADSYSEIMLGRLIQGLGVGIITIVLPLYLAETTPAYLRGRGVTLFQLFLTAGILIAALSDTLFHKSGNWRAMFGIALIPGTIFFIGSLFLIKSPRWLFKKGFKDKALNVLLRITDDEEARRSYNELIELEDREKDFSFNIKNLREKFYILPFILALSVGILNQAVGINSILQFSTYIIKQTGVPSVYVAMMGTVSITLMNFIITIIAFLLIDKIGRRPLLTIGTFGCMLSLFFVGLVLLLAKPSNLQGYLTIFGLIVYISFFAIGPGVVVWLAVSEILPLKIRSISMSIALFANSLTSAILAAIFLDLTKFIGYAGPFFLCGFFALLYFLITFLYLPESKGMTLEEVEVYWKDRC
ncbi:MAG: sugar porter family MFS transporter [Deferribacterota bacterium]|nr:sugar porter family MFS transporter [Deferribacterota bacterium]